MYTHCTALRVHGKTSTLLFVCCGNHGNLDRYCTTRAFCCLCIFPLYPSVRVLDSLHSIFFVNAFSFSFTVLGSPTKIRRERERSAQDVCSLLFSLFFFAFLFFGALRVDCLPVLLLFLLLFFHFIHSTFYFLSHLSLFLFHSFTVCHSGVCTLKAFFGRAPRLHFLHRELSCSLPLSSPLFYSLFSEIIAAAHLRHFLNELLSLVEWLAHTHARTHSVFHKTA